MAPEPGRGNSDAGSDILHDDNVEMTTKALANTCDVCKKRMQTVADLLLLTSDIRPVRTPSLSVFGESLQKCRDTITSRTRGLTVLLRDLSAQLHDGQPKLSEVAVCIEEICDLVVSLTECCAHASYLLAVLEEGSTPEVPGPVDRYLMCRAAAEVEHKCAVYRVTRLPSISSRVLTELTNSTCENAALLADACLKASEEVVPEGLKEQFRASMRSINASANNFSTSVRNMRDRPSEFNRRNCEVFAEVLVACCNATAVFATQDTNLTGKPANLSQAGRMKMQNVFSACMNIVSPCVLICSLIRDQCSNLKQNIMPVRAKLHLCQTAIMKGTVRLAQSLGVTVIDVSLN